MVGQLNLDASGGCLQIEFDTHNWGRCFLLAKNRTYLGAESKRYLVEHLLARLEEPTSEPVGELAGRPVKWVLSLAEGQSILYVSAENSNRTLHWQNAKAEWIASLRLSQDQWQQWKQQLGQA